jgi:hypothetical protein
MAGYRDLNYIPFMRSLERLLRALLIVPALIALSGMQGRAVPFDNRPKILLHVSGAANENFCGAGTLSDCNQAVTRGALTPIGGPGYYFVYLHAVRGPLTGLAGLQCGIGYQNNQPGDARDFVGVDIFAWTLCAALEFISPGPNAWPRPGGGNLITWDSNVDCQTGETGVAGYFYVAAYNRDALFVTPRPVDAQAKVADCQSVEAFLFPSDLGCASFSSEGTHGCNPCVSGCFFDPVETSTWSRIKTFSR